jgi:hypothetical protein
MTELELLHDFRYLTVIGGLAGGIALFLYIRPQNLGDAIIRVVVAILATNMLTDIIAHRFLGATTDGELWGLAFLIGFCSWPIGGWIANFFHKEKNSDIVTVAKSIKDDIKG